MGGFFIWKYKLISIHKIKNMEAHISTVGQFWQDYGLFVWAGLMGSIAYCVSTPSMGIRGTVGHVIRSIFIGALVGIGVSELTDISDNLIFVVTGASCYFANSIIDETKEIISNISDYIDKKLKIKD